MTPCNHAHAGLSCTLPVNHSGAHEAVVGNATFLWARAASNRGVS